MSRGSRSGASPHLRVAGMATMPTRLETAPRAIASLVPQVDRLWLFLDRFDAVPAFAEDERIRIVRSEDVGDLRANGKLAALLLDHGQFTFFGVDDDIEYPADYCERLTSALDRLGDVAVGVHAGVLRTPVSSYRSDLKVLHRRSAQARAEGADLLGSDSLAFRTTTLRFDVRAWLDVNMVDLSFALEARRRGIPLVMLPRGAHWLRTLDENQDDSIWAGVLRDDSRQTELARELMSMSRPLLPRGRRLRRLSYRSV
jgi:hypothetical protein